VTFVAQGSNDCLSSTSSNGTYGFVYRNGTTSILPQRSLESPQSAGKTCDILLDVQRSAGSCGEPVYRGVAPDLMTKSYHDHYYHDMPWVDHRMRMMQVAETDWKHGAMLAAQVVSYRILYAC